MGLKQEQKNQRMLTLNEFIKKYLGKTLGYPEGSFQGECLSLAKWYIKECFGFNPPPSGSNSAYGYWSNFPSPLGQFFTKVENTPTGIPKRGDIILWEPTPSNSYGHIAIFLEGTDKSFKSLDQNWGGKETHEQGHYYTNVKGWLTPKLTMPDELQKVLDHYSVKTADELIEMVDKEFGFLKSGRETITKLETLLKTQKNDLEALQLVKDSLSIKLSGVEAEKDNAKQMFRDLIDKMALTVGTVADEGAIIKKITSDVEELDLSQKSTKKVTEELNKYRSEKENEILNLKREIGELRADLYKKDVQLTNLSKRIDDLEKLPPVTPKISIIERIKKEIDLILSIIRKV